MISAKVIADSVSPQGHRLTTFEPRDPDVEIPGRGARRCLKNTEENADADRRANC